MIGGIFFLASIIAIFVVLRWFARYDGKPEGEIGGFLAMKAAETAPVSRKRKAWSREDALRR